MADTKITALTALTAADPANDVLPIVDVSDTTMAASGTTKKISVNNILGAGGTATLASATITGDLTVDTSTLKVDSANNRVGIGTASPSGIFHAANLGTAGTTADNFNGYFSSANRNCSIYLLAKNTEGSNFYFGDGDNNTIGGIIYDHTSNYMRFDANGSEQMRLNSTGLGVGVTPAAGDGSGAFKAAGTGSLTANSRVGLDVRELVSGNQAGIILGAMTTENTAVIGSRTGSGNIAFQTYYAGSWGERMRIANDGNVGIGVTPSAWSAGKAVELAFKGNSLWSYSQDNNYLSSNAYFNGGWKYGGTGKASLYSQFQGTHIWSIAGSGTAGNAITLTDAMTLDASGILAIGTVALGYTSSKSTYFSPVVGYWIGNHTTGTPSGDRYWGFGYGINEVGSITQDGTTGVLYNITSDYRLKEQVQPLVGGLARVNALKPSVYKWKSDGSNGEGFLAHELAEVVPFAVSGEKDAVNEDGSIKSQGIDMSRVVPILVAAIQELTARVQTLETR